MSVAAVVKENQTRAGYLTEVIDCKFVYLRRPHPADPVELCLGTGHHDCTIVRLTPEQLAELGRDAVALHFARHVKA